MPEVTPGRSEFSADEEREMRAGQRAIRTGLPDDRSNTTDIEITKDGGILDPYRMSPRDLRAYLKK